MQVCRENERKGGPRCKETQGLRVDEAGRGQNQESVQSKAEKRANETGKTKLTTWKSAARSRTGESNHSGGKRTKTGRCGT